MSASQLLLNMPLVYFRPENQNPPRNGNLILSGITLKPGENELSQKDIDTISKHPSFANLQSLSAIQIENPKPDRKKTKPAEKKKPSTKTTEKESPELPIELPEAS